MSGTGEATPEVKGWCPGALRPMLSGDGWVVRIRPPLGWLSEVQAVGIADLAKAHGNGMLDLSNRANLQIRGVTQAGHAPLIEGLSALGLVDADAASEARRNIIVTPFADGQTLQFATLLAKALAQWNGPDVPGKFGFAIDAGLVPILRDSPADVRLERDVAGRLLVCAEGAEFGKPVTEAHVIEEMTVLACEALSSGLGKRMGAMLAQGFALPGGYGVQRQQGQASPPPGAVEQGFLVGFAFGQIHAQTLRELSNLGPLRMTPWRMMLVEDIYEPPQLGDLITRPDDPLRRVVACTGAPGCSQGLAAVRPLARSLARHVPSGKILHVSGCAKGCAHPRVADLTLVAVRDGFNFIRDARASDPPERRHIQPEKLSELI